MVVTNVEDTDCFCSSKIGDYVNIFFVQSVCSLSVLCNDARDCSIGVAQRMNCKGTFVTKTVAYPRIERIQYHTGQRVTR